MKSDEIKMPETGTGLRLTGYWQHVVVVYFLYWQQGNNMATGGKIAFCFFMFTK